MGLWAHAFAAGYDRFMAASEKAGLAAEREGLVSMAAGRVLEIGGGTGANLSFYRGAVSELVITEPDPLMAIRLERKLDGYRIPTRVVRAPAEQLPFESESFDCAVTTLVLCTVSEPMQALAEMMRLLKPGGRLLFIEHVRSEDPRLARWHDRFRRPWSWFGCGCQCNRSTVASIRAAGFSMAELRQGILPRALPIVRPLATGIAARQGDRVASA